MKIQLDETVKRAKISYTFVHAKEALDQGCGHELRMQENANLHVRLS